MGETVRWNRLDWLGVALVAVLGGGAFAFRLLAIMPRATVGVCAAADAPGFCLPRHWVLTGQYYGTFGWAALAVGLFAFIRGCRVSGAVALGLGLAAVVNYNATQGIIGAALGLTAWLSLLSGRWKTA